MHYVTVWRVANVQSSGLAVTNPGQEYGPGDRGRIGPLPVCANHVDPAPVCERFRYAAYVCTPKNGPPTLDIDCFRLRNKDEP